MPDINEHEEHELSDALTRIEGDDEEELTPIKERLPATPPEVSEISSVPRLSAPKGTTFVATLRERFAAFFIDSLFLFYVYWICAIAYGRIFLASWDAAIPLEGWHALAFHGSFLCVCFFYYFLLEGIFLATLGKSICWMSVRKKNGEPASLLGVFVRNLLRFVDYAFIIPVAFIMELTRYKQRLGDIITGGTVVKKFSHKAKTYSVTPDQLLSATGRTFAAIIDLFIFALFAGGYILLMNPNAPLISRWILLFSPLAFILYFMLIEMISETSPGKWLAGCIICHDNGRRLTISGSLVRTLWLVIDVNPLGALCIFLSSLRQRPGDLAAGTVILKHHRNLRGASSILIAIVLAAATIYPGLMNKDNILSSTFKLNFLPNFSFLNNLKVGEAPAGPFAVQNFRFAANEPTDFRNPPMFTAGETVFIVFEVKDYTKRERDAWMQEDLSVTYPDGTVGLNQQNIVDFKQVVRGNAPIEFSNNITLPMNSQPGEYVVNVTVRDKFGGNEAKDLKKFYVRENIYSNPED